MIEEVAKNHLDWVRVLVSLGCDKDDAEDIIQNMYVKLMEVREKKGSWDFLKYKDTYNRRYVYTIFKNMYIDSLRKKKETITFNEFISSPEDEEYDYEADEEFDELIDLILDEVKELKPFRRRLFELYYNICLNRDIVYNPDNLSQRKIARDSNLSLKTVSQHLIAVKEKIKNGVRGNSNNYINEKNS